MIVKNFIKISSLEYPEIVTIVNKLKICSGYDARDYSEDSFLIISEAKDKG